MTDMPLWEPGIVPRPVTPRPYLDGEDIERLGEQHDATGQELRDAALAQSKQWREEKIQRVREKMLTDHIFDHGRGPSRITGDDVLAVAEELGYAGGDRRWVAHVLMHWSPVEPTGQYQKSRRPECHARPKMLWRWK